MEYTAELVSTSLAHNNAILKTLVNTTDQLAILEPSSDIAHSQWRLHIKLDYIKGSFRANIAVCLLWDEARYL